MNAFFFKFLKNQKPSRLVYQKLVTNKSEQPYLCQEKWYKDINLDPNEKIDWEIVYLSSFKCSNISKLITFYFKLLHRRLATNSFLQKIGLSRAMIDAASVIKKEKI